MQGNVVLTDSNYEVLTLLRSHRDDDKGMALMPRHPYPIHTIRLRTPLDADQLAAALAATDAKATIKGKLVPQPPAEAWVKELPEGLANMEINHVNHQHESNASEFCCFRASAVFHRDLHATFLWVDLTAPG